MPQQFTDNARALLTSGIGAGDLSLTVEAAKADRFPSGNTTNWATPLNFFKLVLIDSAGNREVIKVGTRSLGSAVMGNILRGQDGTVARSFAVGAAVICAFVAQDAADMSQKTDIQAQSYTAFTTAGNSLAYTISPVPALTSVTAGQSFFITFHTVCASSPTLQISGLASPPNLVRQLTGGGFVNVAFGEIPANHRSRVTLLSATQALVETMPPRITGTVSQSAGVPTGAVIERGSSANGQFVKFADGTLICTLAITGAAAVNPYITGLQVATIPWNFPATFAANPVVTGSGVDQAVAGWVTGNPMSTSTCNIFYYTKSTVITNVAIYVMAVGRWF